VASARSVAAVRS